MCIRDSWNYVYSGDACPPGYTPAAPVSPDPGFLPPAPGPAACAPSVDAFNGGSAPAEPNPPAAPGVVPPASYIGYGTDGVIGVDQVTELPKSPVSEEEPFLYTGSSGNWDAFEMCIRDSFHTRRSRLLVRGLRRRYFRLW